MDIIDREFKNLLRSYNFDDLEAHSGTIFGVWENFLLAYMNPEWFRFAEKNGGEPCISNEWRLGRSILDCMSVEIKGFYRAKFRNILDFQTVWSHEYDCSSEAVYRRCHQIIYPLGQQEGLLFVNSLVAQQHHDHVERYAQVAGRLPYMDNNGLICQCSFCRRVKHANEDERWDWVPGWVDQYPENTTHTFCPACFGYYFPLSAKVDEVRNS